ncbi:hypothetical protein BG000_001515 [Podila horticola]|nr:hypothetical protein BG000_001515 [Podila horticola]
MTENIKKRPKAKGEGFNSTLSSDNREPSSQFTQSTSWFSQFITTGTPVPDMLVSQTVSSRYNAKAHSANQIPKTTILSANQSNKVKTTAGHKSKSRTQGASQTLRPSRTFQREAANATDIFGPPVPSSNLFQQSSTQIFQSSSQFFEDRARRSQIAEPERSPTGQIFPPGQGASSQASFEQNRFSQSLQLEQTSTSQVFQFDQSSVNQVFPEQASSSQLFDDQHRGSSQHNEGQTWRSSSHLTDNEATSSFAYYSTSPWSSDIESAFHSFTTAPSSRTLMISNLQSLVNDQPGSIQQTEGNTQSFSQLSVNQSESASQGFAAQGWSSSQTWRSATVSQCTGSTDDIASPSQTSTIYISSDSDTDSKDASTLDPDSELDSNKIDSDRDSDGDDSDDSDSTLRRRRPVSRFENQASQSLSGYSYSKPCSLSSQEHDGLDTTAQRRRSASRHEGWERQYQPEYSFSQGSQPSQELFDSEDGYPSRLQAFMDGRHGTEEDSDDEPQSQELDYGVGSWSSNPTVPGWLSELDDDDDDDDGSFYESLERIRHQ